MPYGLGVGVGHIVYKGQHFNSFDEFYDWVLQHPEERDEILASLPPQFGSLFEAYDRYYAAQKGDPNVSYNDVLESVGRAGASLDPVLEKSFDNTIARENTSQAQGFEQYMRDTNILSSAQQYAAAGLSPSSVIQGGISTSNGVAAADNVKSNVSMQKYQQRMTMARSILGMVSQMASSGIYGTAIGSARNAAARISASAAHSGLQALQNMRPELRQQLMIDAQARGDKLY